MLIWDTEKKSPQVIQFEHLYEETINTVMTTTSVLARKFHSVKFLH